MCTTSGDRFLPIRLDTRPRAALALRTLTAALVAGSLLFPLAACSVSDGGLSSASNFTEQPEAPSSTEETADTDSADGDAAATEVASADAPASESGTERKVDDETAPETAVPLSAAVAAPQEEIASTAAEREPEGSAETETEQPSSAPALAVAPTEEKREMPFARLFSRGGNQTSSDDEPVAVTSPRATEPPVEKEQASTEGADDTQEETAAAEEPAEEDVPTTASITTASIDRGPQRASLSVASDGPPLPGVREVSSLYELPHRENFDYRRYDNEPVQVASAAGLAALAGGRLAVQHESVDVACLKPKLVQTLKRIEAHFGRKMVVTSGYRNRKHNRRVGGARESKHMYCQAADIQIPGVSKWQLAEYARSMPGRGGVGTYCHTESVHVDIGSKRDWNWRCRRRK